MSNPTSTDLFIKNPHSILPALQNRPKDVIEVILPRDKTDDTWVAIEELANKHKVRVRDSLGNANDRPAASGSSFNPKHRGGSPGGKPGSRRDRTDRSEGPKDIMIGRESSHGALIRPKPSISIEKMFEKIDGQSRGVWLALDCLQDPQNLGAIFRSASFFGVKGIIMTTERSAPMTYTVYDIASGGVEAVPFVGVVNLQRAFELAKEAGLWTLGTSEHAKESIYKIKNDRPWLVVMGNEEKGIRRLTEDSCDMMCTIPCKGKGVTSLNVSVATGVMLSVLG